MKTLYHATYDTHRDSILKTGLRGKHWQTGAPIVYLADDLIIAENYALDNPDAPEDSRVIVFAVDPNKLNLSHLRELETFEYDEVFHTYDYAGDVPADALTEVL